MTTHRIADFWKKHIQEWGKSGLSQTEYARKHQISVKTFGYHKRRHFTNDTTRPTSDSTLLIPVSVTEEPVRKKQTLTKSTETGITLVSPNGFRIELTAGFDHNALQQALKILEAV